MSAFFNTYNRFFLLLTLVIGGFFIPVQAAITGASVSPSSLTLSASSDNIVTLSWQVTADSSHSTGVSSSSATLVNVGDGASLGSAGSTLSASGVGPYSFVETFSFSAAKVQGWQASGITQIKLSRVFSDPATGSNAAASMTLSVPVIIVPPTPTGGLTGASVTPSQSVLSDSNNNSVNLSWRVTASSGHSTGVTSTSGVYLDSVTGSTIGTISGSLSASGSGPFTLGESLTISASQVRSWQTQGFSQVTVRRIFSDASTSTSASASMTLVVPAATPTAPTGLTTAQVTPSQFSLQTGTTNTLSLTWTITAESGHSTGLSSSSGRYENAANGGFLGSAGGTLGASGSGPFSLQETLLVASSQVQNWQLQGISQVVLRRTFSDTVTGTMVSAQVLLDIPAPLPTGLTDASVNQSVVNLSVTQTNIINLRWSVLSESGHNEGVNSTSARLLDEGSGVMVGSLGALLSANGSGPFTLSETLSISSSQVQGWQQLGYDRLVLQRQFSDQSSSTLVSAQLILNVPEIGSLQSATVSPSTFDLSATNNNTLRLTWGVSAEAGYASGVESSNGTYMNPVSQVVIGSAGARLSATGNAPYTLTENVFISPTQVKAWQDQGLSSVTLRRLFGSSVNGAQVSAQVTLRLPERGNVKSARVGPVIGQVFASQDNKLPANWQIVTGSDHRNGILSNSAVVKNPRTGVVLAEIGSPLSANGTGPFLFSETLQLAANDVRQWQIQGIDRVVIERQFSDPVNGDSTLAAMTVTLQSNPLLASRSSAEGSLTLQGMRLAFANGSRLALTEMNEALRAELTITYGGSGLLQGVWQVAEPGSTETTAIYRTLTLVRQHMAGGRRSVLTSPDLPTTQSGKYLVRFCVTGQQQSALSELGQTGQCGDEQLMVNAAYQVQNASTDALLDIVLLSPGQQTVNRNTSFSWQTIAEAKVYRLQVFEQVFDGINTENAGNGGNSPVPKFVTGLVLPASTTTTSLTELMRSKLENGQVYQWRITAHDSKGKLMGNSRLSAFMYHSD